MHKLRILRISTIAVLLAGASLCAAAADFPIRPITFITPNTGNAGDTLARILAPEISADLRTPVIVEARPGAGGNISSQAVAKAPADGYTLLFAVGAQLTINPLIYAKPGFDPVADFKPVALVASSPYLVVANPGLSVKSVADLVKLSKNTPGGVNYGTAGVGSLGHMVGEMLNKEIGAKLVHVPYKTSSSANSDAMAGFVSASIGSLPSLMPLVKAGKLQALGMVTPGRSTLLPDVPAISESIPGFSVGAWYGVLAPTGTPQAVVDRVSASLAKALAKREVVELLAAQGIEPAPGNAEKLAALIREDLAKWKQVIASTGISAE